MTIDDKCQLPSQVRRLTGQVHRREQLIARLNDLILLSQQLATAHELSPQAAAYPSDPISLQDAARLLAVHQSFVHRLIKQGSLRSCKLLGGHRRVSKAAVLAFPEPCQATPPPPPRAATNASTE